MQQPAHGPISAESSVIGNNAQRFAGNGARTAASPALFGLEAGNLADWRILELHYKDDLARPSVKGDFQLPGISSVLPFSNLRTLCRCLTRSSGKARTGRKGAVPTRNHLPADCKS